MSDRARQFMPFSALKGFEELVEEKHRVVVARRELSEDKMTELSEKIKYIKKGMMVKIIHFSEGEYIETEGIVSETDFTFRKVTIVKTKISFDDIAEISY